VSGAVDLSENSASHRHSRFRGRSASFRVEEQVEVSRDMAEGPFQSHILQIQFSTVVLVQDSSLDFDAEFTSHSMNVVAV
jgi:hypothetical protein